MVSLFQQHNVYFVFHFVALSLAASCLSPSNISAGNTEFPLAAE